MGEEKRDLGKKGREKHEVPAGA